MFLPLAVNSAQLMETAPQLPVALHLLALMESASLSCTPYLMELILGIAGIARHKLILFPSGLLLLVVEFVPYGPVNRKPLNPVLIGAASKFGLRFLLIALKI